MADVKIYESCNVPPDVDHSAMITDSAGKSLGKSGDLSQAAMAYVQLETTLTDGKMMFYTPEIQNGQAVINGSKLQPDGSADFVFSARPGAVSGNEYDEARHVLSVMGVSCTTKDGKPVVFDEPGAPLPGAGDLARPTREQGGRT